MNSKMFFCNNGIGFTPYLNRDQLSLFNHEFSMSLGIITLIIINIFSLAILVFIYQFFKKREYTNVYYEITFLFIFSGTLCSLIDKIVYKGSIDYMLLGGHIYDIKDVYLFIAVLFLTMYIFTYLMHEVKKRRVK